MNYYGDSDDPGTWFKGRRAGLKLTLYIGACVAAPAAIALLLVALRFS